MKLVLLVILLLKLKELRSKCLTSVCVQSQQSVQNNWELKIRILRIRLASFTTKITIISKET